MTHVWFELPNGTQVGRQVLVIPRQGDFVRFERDGHPYRVRHLEVLAAQKIAHSKVRVWLEG